MTNKEKEDHIAKALSDKNCRDMLYQAFLRPEPTLTYPSMKLIKEPKNDFDIEAK